MRLLQGVLLLTVVVCGAAAYQQKLSSASQQQPTLPKLAPSPATPAQALSNQEINDRYEQQLLEKISGRENEPAEKVFKNLRLEGLKSEPAENFLGIMNGGYSRALGVNCTHCHVEQDFASDDKRPKRAAREMAVMHRMINQQLGKMQNLTKEPEKRFINCATCHRGAVDPRSAAR
jgi:hypothetical protein